MRIFLDTKGKHIVIKRMEPYWKEMGWEIHSDPKKCDVQLSFVNIMKNTGLPTVVRIDGVYYDKGSAYSKRNSPISKAHRKANGIIYQSEIAKIMAEKFLGKRGTDIYEIIYNGIGSEWNLEPNDDKKNIIVSCAKWRRPKRLQETVELFKQVLTYTDAELYIIGPMGKGCSKINHKKITYFDKVKNKKLKEIYRDANVYIHLCKKDSCPNTVVEAIGAGLPVITTNACGGATEMCQMTPGCEIVHGEEESFKADYIYKDPYNKMPKDVRKRMAKRVYKVLNENRRVDLPKELTVEYMAKRYIKLMKKVIKHG